MSMLYCNCESSLCDHGTAGTLQKCYRNVDPRLRMEYVVWTCERCAQNMRDTGGAAYITEVPLREDLVAAVKAWAMENYERGADVIVECLDDLEVHVAFVNAPNASTPEEAIAAAREFCGLRAEQATNVLQPDINHKEWKQAVEDAKYMRGL